MDKFWKAALGMGGVAAIGAFVFYSLYKDWLTLDIFERLTSDQTFIIMLFFLVLVFLVAIGMLIAWFLDKGRSNSQKGENTVTFSIPADCSFKQGAIALASEEKAIIMFEGIPEEKLKETLKRQTLEASNTKRALELLSGLASSGFPLYLVTLEDGKYTLTSV